MAYEIIAGIQPAKPLTSYFSGLQAGTEMRQNEEINQANIEASKVRTEAAGIELSKAKKQVAAEDTWAKLPRSEDGALDPQAEEQFKTQYPEYYDTRKKAEVAQLRDQIGLAADQFTMASTLFGKAKSPDDIAKAQAFAKENFGLDIEYDESVFGTVQKYSSELAQKSALIQEDIAAAAAAGDYATVTALTSAFDAQQNLAQLEVQKAQWQVKELQASTSSKNASAYKSFQQGNKAASEAAGTATPKPAEVIAQTKEQERLAKQQQKKDLLVAAADDTIHSIDKAIENVDWMASGITGKVAGAIPGTETYDQNQLITTIKANIGFDRLQQMRDASPTGGALGQVAIQELVALQASIASLDVGQNQETQLANLRKVKKHYENWRRTVTGESVLKNSGDGKKRVKFSDLPE